MVTSNALDCAFVTLTVYESKLLLHFSFCLAGGGVGFFIVFNSRVAPSFLSSFLFLPSPSLPFIFETGSLYTVVAFLELCSSSG